MRSCGLVRTLVPAIPIGMLRTMPSKALLMLIARAARSSAAATCRFARWAALPLEAASAAAAASLAPDRGGGGDDRLLHRSAAAAAAPPAAMDAPNPRTDAVIGPGLSCKDLRHNRRVEFVAQEKDLESDEVMWALYERWCKVLDQKRSHDEMVSRFGKFKNTVLLTHRCFITNNANMPSYQLVINKFADGKLQERLRANADGNLSMLAKKVGNSSVLRTRDGGFLREVFADFKVVDGKLFVYFPAGKTDQGGLKELSTTSYVVTGARLFADLPEGHELVIPYMEFLICRDY